MRGLVFILSLIFVSKLHSIPPTTAEEFLSCVRQIESQFVQTRILSEALSINRVQQTQWVPISTNFQRQMRGLVAAFKQEATQSVPNALNPFDLQRSRLILRRIMLNRLNNALNTSNYYNPGGADAILEFLTMRQPQHIIDCLITPIQVTTPSAQQPSRNAQWPNNSGMPVQTAPQWPNNATSQQPAPDENTGPVMPIEEPLPWQPTPSARPRWQ